MAIKNILYDYIYSNKTIFFTYISVCCILYILKVIGTAVVYFQLFDNDKNFNSVVKNIILLWTALYVFYISKIKLEKIIFPNLLAHLRKKLFENYIISNEYNFNDSDISSDLSKMLDISRVCCDFIMILIQSIIPTIVLSISITVYFFYTNPYVGYVNLISNVVSYKIISNKIPILLEKAKNIEIKNLNMFTKLEEKINNLMNIYINNLTDKVIDDNLKIQNEFEEHYSKFVSEVEDIIGNVKMFIYVFALINLYVLFQKKNKDFIMGLLLFTLYLGIIETLSEELPWVIFVLGNIVFLEKELGQKNKNYIELNPDFKPNYTKNLNNFQGNIIYDNVSFGYDDDLIINDFNLKIDSGDKIAIMARSGSGKTTLMKLLLGFYKPNKGNIYLDAIKLDDIDVKEIRDKINYINQKTILFNDTVINNMKYGNNKSDNEIINLLKKYNLLKIFNQNNNSALSKMVEINGTNISMGMQKVIFLVRGILKNNTNVYLFDEPLTSLDPETRKNVLNMIKNETKDKTTIIVTHDKEVENIVDKVIKPFDKNKIIL